MQEIVVVQERTGYNEPTANASKAVVFHNRSADHVIVVSYDTITGKSVEVTILKEQIPDWVNKKRPHETQE